MDNRRLAIVAGLGVVELWILGLMIRSVGGGGQQPPYASLARGPGSRTPRTLETGPAPHVVIDGEEATLVLRAQPGTTVTVGQETVAVSWVHGADAQPVIERTSDGVRIAQSGTGLGAAMGALRRRLEVVVPPQAKVDVRESGSMSVSGLRADATLHSDDGSIAVTDQRGSLDVKTDNGRIVLVDVEAPSIDAGSDNGRVILDRVRAERVAIVTDNGRIDISRSRLGGGNIQTDSGRIRLALDAGSDVTIRARAASGKVSARAPLTLVSGDGDDGPATIRFGNGSGQLDVGSDDGSITVAAEGA